MKKIALALVAVSALGLAACGDRTESNTAADTNTEATANEANGDVSNAQDAANNALDELGDAAENAGEAVENAVDAAGDAAENATR